MKYLFFILFVSQFQIAIAQIGSKKEVNQIYEAALSDFLGANEKFVIMKNVTDNVMMQRENFLEGLGAIVDGDKMEDFCGWYRFFKIIDKPKSEVRTIVVPTDLKSIHKLHYINADSVAFQTPLDYIRTKYPGAYGFLSVSDIIFSADGNKAVVGVDIIRGPLDGHGTMFLMEKRNGAWKKIASFGTWIA